MKEIIGYKAFKSNLCNKYGFQFEMNTVYQKNKKLSHEDIFQYATICTDYSLESILALYPFTKEELQVLKEVCIKRNHKEALQNLNLCQTGDAKTFKRSHEYLYGKGGIL